MIIDLFAGPGGWTEGLRALGLADVGIEWDAAACQTRAAAGHTTIRADVATYPPERFAGAEGLIASPPCPTFSLAGKGGGGAVLDLITQAMTEAWHGRPWRLLLRQAARRLRADALATSKATRADAAASAWSTARQAFLVVHVVRWLRVIQPAWVAMEQVPPALPLWQHLNRLLAGEGYSTWAGVLNAADYGVPQTRRRAILMASRERTAMPPVPTHCDQRQSPSLFELPWVSMAEALGWGMDARPMPTVTGGGCAAGGPEPIAKSGRVAVEREREVVGYRRTRGTGMSDRHGDRPDTPTDEPAPAITSKARSDEWIVLDRRQTGAPPLDCRAVPAPTLTGAAIGKGVWVVRTGASSMKHNRDAADVVPYERDVAEPAPTIDTKAVGAWTLTRPATTIVGSFCPDVVAAPGYRTAGSGPRQNAPGSIKITEQDALILQSFDPDYPLQGSRSKRFEQVGNAVPPRLAMHIIAALTGVDIGQAAA